MDLKKLVSNIHEIPLVPMSELMVAMSQTWKHRRLCGVTRERNATKRKKDAWIRGYVSAT